jgi:cystathionine gamma-lyase
MSETKKDSWSDVSWSSLDTLCVHGDCKPDTRTGAINTPIYLSTTFVQDGPGEHRGYHYGRAGNPTRTVLESTLAKLEGASHAYSFASGCAATSAMLLTLSKDSHIIVGDDVYSGTFRLLRQIMSEFGVEATFMDLGDPARIVAAIRPTTRMIWAESPTNPLLKIFDLSAIGQVARDHGLAFVVDNTFATPVLQRPLDLGATVSLHSTTKYLNGHCDVLGGVLLTNDAELADRLYLLQRGVGAVPSPFDCYMVLRGLKTLSVRMRQQVQNASALAEWLSAAPGVAKVYYPGLPSHPGASLAARQMRAPGAILSIDLDGGLAGVQAFLKELRIFYCAISLGGVESLIDHPATMTHAATPANVRHEVGIGDSLVRLSIGLESVDDLREDLERGLYAARKV